MITTKITTIFYLILVLVTSAQAQTSVTTYCPTSALNIRLYEKALQQKIISSLDISKYKKISVNVNLRRGAKVGKTQKTYTLDQILSGLTVTQSELTTLVSGTVAFAEVCSYTYVANVTISAVEKGSKVKLKTVTDSLITITSSGNFRIKGEGNSSSISADPATLIE